MNENIFSKAGLSKDEVISQLASAGSEDANWREGRTWSLVYFAGDEVLEVVKEAYSMYLSTNGLSPFAFPSLRRFEHEVVSMTLEMLDAPAEGVGTMTSGGTESIMMAIKSARDRGRVEKGITAPEMVVPESVHPAFYKAAHYFGVELKLVPVGEDFKADVEAARALVNENTVLMAGSAPGYPHGVIDDIPRLAAIAHEHDTCFHVDACVGGFMLPWVKATGRTVAPWNFEVEGVTSISADCHKYGYAARGASTISYRSDAYRKYQFFAYTDWNGGLYGSPSFLGSRPGGAIAAAWAALNYLGQEGYIRLVGDAMDTAEKLQAGINAIEGLTVLGDPAGTIFAFGASEGSDLDVYAVGDLMKEKGWGLDPQQKPAALHLMVTPAHKPIADQFIAELNEAVETVRQGEAQASSPMSGMYGMAGAMPDTGPLKEMIVELMGGLLPPRAG